MKSARLIAILYGLCAPLGLASSCDQNETANEFASKFNLKGKVAIVTGGDSGLGFAASEALARQGAAVVIAGHSVAKSDAAARNLSIITGGDVRSLPIDLESFANVRAFVGKFLKDFDRLDLLINDAGIAHEYVHGGKTVDGFEEVFQVNYLSAFLLTELLLPTLRKSSPSRVVHVASVAHTGACQQAGWGPDCAKDFTYVPPPVTTSPNLTIYGFSKLLMIEHAAELAAREAKAKTGVTAFSLCPGLVVTDMTKENPEIFKYCKLMPDFQQPCPYNPQQGAAVITYTALGDAQPGLWYERRKGCSASPIVTQGFTDAMRPELYSRSLKMAGLPEMPTSAIVV